jgi:hypothetical protein
VPAGGNIPEILNSRRGTMDAFMAQDERQGRSIIDAFICLKGRRRTIQQWI